MAEYVKDQGMLFARGDIGKLRMLQGAATRVGIDAYLFLAEGMFDIRQPPVSNLNYKDDRLSVDFDNHDVTVRGAPVRLYPSDFLVLSLLLKPPGKLRKIKEIYEYTHPDWLGPENPRMKARVKMNILRLRKALQDEPYTPRLRVVLGLSNNAIGYKYVPPA